MQHSPPSTSRATRDWIGIVLVGTILTCLAVLGLNIWLNMQAAGMTRGFGFLAQTAGFDLSESLIRASASDSYGRVIVAGLLNTVFLAVCALVLATVLGVLMGLVSVTPSPAGRLIAMLYVELFRNLPKILVLLVLYVMTVRGLPSVREAISIGPIHLSNRSIYLPTIEADPRQAWLLLPLALACAVAVLWHRHAGRIKRETGRELPVLPVVLAAVFGLPLAFGLAFGTPMVPDLPELRRFDFEGGARFSIQFMVVLLTLGLYHGAQVAEVVRGGILSVPRGHIEAAMALGMAPRSVTRFVILPQVVRIIIPPIINQYVNLIKNTSIAIAVGYSDLMSVSGTIINQTFRPLEVMLITMGLYLGLCLVTSWGMNHLNDSLRARSTGQSR
ncbi:amino acid ABC transporter permease [Stappia sp. TSB10GB4]|uniref:amino acid ABC transporter permease n=1 Tax=Stappia sp. TSB10GB4 TaxID=2003584 RepID=UPI001647EF6E|nr:ABC transporter permease subunit [Stappia sp. TSB10GB4]